jgi:hypothetical protein
MIRISTSLVQVLSRSVKYVSRGNPIGTCSRPEVPLAESGGFRDPAVSSKSHGKWIESLTA